MPPSANEADDNGHRRYPLIFGSWCKQLSIEAPFVKSIEKSVKDIIKRSTDPAFRKRAVVLLKSLRTNAAREYAEAARTINVPSPEAKGEAFLYAMEKVYKLGQKRRRFKGTSRVVDNDDEHALHDADVDKEELGLDVDVAPVDDVFAASQESLLSESSDFDWDMSGDTLELAATGGSVDLGSHSGLSVPPSLFQDLPTDDDDDDVLNDDYNASECEANTTSPPLDDLDTTSDDFLALDSDISDSGCESNPAPEPHDLSPGRSCTTVSTHNPPFLDGYESDLEDVFGSCDQFQKPKEVVLESVYAAPLSQDLSSPDSSPASAHEFNAYACSSPREDILADFLLESDSDDFDLGSFRPGDYAKPCTTQPEDPSADLSHATPIKQTGASQEMNPSPPYMLGDGVGVSEWSREMEVSQEHVWSGSFGPHAGPSFKQPTWDAHEAEDLCLSPLRYEDDREEIEEEILVNLPDLEYDVLHDLDF